MADVMSCDICQAHDERTPARSGCTRRDDEKLPGRAAPQEKTYLLHDSAPWRRRSHGPDTLGVLFPQ